MYEQHLQKVLAKKRDPVTHVCFLEELNQNRNTHLVQRFWTEVTGLLTKEFNKAASGKNGVRFLDYPIYILISLN